MVVISDCFGGSDLTCESRAYFQDSNETFAAVSDCIDNRTAGLTQNILENSINIVKLQYCNSLADIDHDYMVVDVFTDSTGYNDSVCTADTTSSFLQSGLNGYYINQATCVEVLCHHVLQNSSGLVGNYYAGTPEGARGSMCARAATICVNYSESIDISNYNMFRFEIRYCGYGCLTVGGSNFIACSVTTNWEDNKSFVCAASTEGNYNYNQILCYCYVRDTGNCWDFYCNGTCKCQVEITTFPNIIACAYSCANSNALRWAMTCLYNLCALSKEQELNIQTVPIEYSAPTQTNYLTLDKVGAGSVVYNVYNASTCALIGEDLEPNALHTLDECVACHYYVLKQCSDGVSCIKSYALAVSEA